MIRPPLHHRLVVNTSKCLYNSALHRAYSSHPPSARLNVPIDYATTPILHHTSKAALSNPELSTEARNGTASRQNLFQAVNSALSHALSSDPSVLLFGEDVAFGGVFRCSMNLASEFGSDRVFNTPLSEQGIVGFAIGAAMEGAKAIAEVQFADCTNAEPILIARAETIGQRGSESAVQGRCQRRADMRRSGGEDAHWWRWTRSTVSIFRTHTLSENADTEVDCYASYHSQSPESLFTHIPGLRVILPRSPAQAKGLLLAAIACPDPCIFLEPKILYRAAVEQVPTEPYTLPLSTAEVLKQGTDVTIVSYGAPLYTCSAAIEKAEKDFGCSVELIDLRTIYPWDRQAVMGSVNKTGRAIVVHESMVNAGVGAEVAATIQEGCFLKLEAPVQRVAGWTTHMGLIYEVCCCITTREEAPADGL
ncbi:hypothetical protein LTR50_003654 [Elasticomyces elasticus]|nr:hypothetical protein LTR50_003654 [Elasticomyces elasticus]